MAEPTIDTVIFDMDDVLCGYDRRVRIDHLSKATGLSAGAITDAIWTSGFDDMADEGVYTAEQYLDETRKRIGFAITAEQWAAARRASMTPRPVMLRMARNLAANTTVAAFTNNGPLMRQMMADIFPEAVDIFGERLFFSCDIGLAKPNPKAFLAVLERLRASPRQTLFIDDNEAYVLGAAEAGLHIHHFKDPDSLAHQLRNFGLL